MHESFSELMWKPWLFLHVMCLYYITCQFWGEHEQWKGSWKGVWDPAAYMGSACIPHMFLSHQAGFPCPWSVLSLVWLWSSLFYCCSLILAVKKFSQALHRASVLWLHRHQRPEQREVKAQLFGFIGKRWPAHINIGWDPLKAREFSDCFSGEQKRVVFLSESCFSSLNNLKSGFSVQNTAMPLE